MNMEERHFLLLFQVGKMIFFDKNSSKFAIHSKLQSKYLVNNIFLL